MSAKDAARLGILEWLRPGEHARAEQLLVELRTLGVTRLRTGLSWADYHTDEGRAWFDWLIPKLARHAELLPCFTYTPPSLGIEPKSSAPPRDPKDYADFLDLMISDYGKHFEWVELWNEPNNLNDWDWRLDPSWHHFSRMIGMAAHWANQRGKKPVLAGMCPTDPNWLGLMGERGILNQVYAIGIHGFPGTWEFSEESWEQKIAKIRDVVDRYGSHNEIWLTEVGYSTWRHDEINQIEHLVSALAAPVERIYWYSAYDLHPHARHQDGFHEDERHYHFGLKAADGEPKLAYRVWRDQGLSGLQEFARSVLPHRAGFNREPVIECGLPERFEGAGFNDFANSDVPAAVRATPAHGVVATNSRLKHRAEKPVLITGGAGFVGTNLAKRLLMQGHSVLILDNLSRSGVESNLRWLCRTYGDRVQFEVADIRDPHLVRAAVHNCSRVYHLAAQVAVTTSLISPQRDFEINTRGTFNVLEALRAMKSPPPLLFTSTNKVYGALEDLEMKNLGRRYVPADSSFEKGINEKRNLDFHSPYGCSKGAADQYVIDYARSYGLPALVFRMSCIYGPHQFGTEDQGWVAHFLIQAMRKRKLTIYGDGCQVRDVLFVDDLTRAMELALDHAEQLSGNAFNIGGGEQNSTSLRELLDQMNQLLGYPADVIFSDWRVGDQKYFVTDFQKFSDMTGWTPSVDLASGLESLHHWLLENVVVSRSVRAATPVSRRSREHVSTR